MTTASIVQVACMLGYYNTSEAGPECYACACIQVWCHGKANEWIVVQGSGEGAVDPFQSRPKQGECRYNRGSAAISVQWHSIYCLSLSIESLVFCVQTANHVQVRAPRRTRSSVRPLT